MKTTISLITYTTRITYTISLIASWCTKMSTREAHSTYSSLFLNHIWLIFFYFDYNWGRNCINRTLLILILITEKTKYPRGNQHDCRGLFRHRVKFHGKAYISVFWKSNSWTRKINQQMSESHQKYRWIPYKEKPAKKIYLRTLGKFYGST